MQEQPVTETMPGGWRAYLQKRVLVIFFLGASSGLPFPLVYSTLSAWLEEAGVERATISTFAWLGFAYSLKFVWAPIVDSRAVPFLSRWLGRRRGWMLLSQLAIGAALWFLAGLDPAREIQAFALLALAVAFASATQDIVIDAYRIESAEDRLQGVLAAAYQYGYRLSLLVSMAGALYLAEFSDWHTTYRIMAGCMALGVITTFLCREPAANQRFGLADDQPLGARMAFWFNHAVAEPFRDFYRRFGKALFLVLLFVSFYRMSDYVLGILANPFYLDLGYSKSMVATIAKVYGAWITLLGVGLGGWAVMRLGVARCLVVATTLIASTNLFFAANALIGAEPWMLAVTISADNLAQGFGGTVLIAYLSSLTNRDFTATQYALLSSFMALLPKFLAGFSGDVQMAIGWLGFFLYACAMGIPAIVLSVYMARIHGRLVGDPPR